VSRCSRHEFEHWI